MLRASLSAPYFLPLRITQVAAGSPVLVNAGSVSVGAGMTIAAGGLGVLSADSTIAGTILVTSSNLLVSTPGTFSGLDAYATATTNVVTVRSACTGTCNSIFLRQGATPLFQVRDWRGGGGAAYCPHYGYLFLMIRRLQVPNSSASPLGPSVSLAPCLSPRA